MYNVEHLMEHYNEALEEMMGAQKYAKLSAHSQDKDEQMMYRNMAKQEVEHADMLIKSVDRSFVDVPPSDPVHQMWMHLKKHIHEWREDIEKHIGK